MPTIIGILYRVIYNIPILLLSGWQNQKINRIEKRLL
jgi:hypothetical protein